MRFDIATLFVDSLKAVLNESIIGRAIKNEIITINYHNIRDFSKDKHRRVDDTPYGGGMGMLMRPQPIYDCYLHILNELLEPPYVIYMSPKGNVLNQEKCKKYKGMKNIFIICGHYEGIDQRVIDEIVDEEISIGDYVLTGGEIAAMVFVDSVARLCDGVLSDESCFTEESHYNGLLEYPQYTKPAVWNDKEVPAVLLSGHHKNINEWRLSESIKITKERRPDLLK